MIYYDLLFLCEMFYYDLLTIYYDLLTMYYSFFHVCTELFAGLCSSFVASAVEFVWMVTGTKPLWRLTG